MLEQAGLATVQLASIRTYVERMQPPRALYCEFPLGRPLGKPGDPAFQRRVLETALELLTEPGPPVLKDFPDRIVDDSETPLACTLPPRFDASLPPAVDEAIGLRPAYERQRERSGRTNVGAVVDADGIPDLVAKFVALAEGAPLEETALPSSPTFCARDVCNYYEEAALALTDHVPAARQAESWIFGSTETGAVLKRAQAALREAGVDLLLWFFVVPRTQQD